LLCSVGAVLALAASASACGSDDSGSATPDSRGASIPDGPIVIGSATARSGPFAAYDTGPATGVELAVEDINRKGGIDGHQLKVVYSDTESDPTKGAAAALDVIAKGAKVVVTSCDFDLGSPAASAAVGKNVVSSSTCGASTKYNPNVLGPLVFTMSTGTLAEGEIMAKWAHEQKQFKTAYLLEDPGFAYAKDLCAGFEKTFTSLPGTKIVGKDTFKSTDAKISAQIARIQSTKPDFVFLCSLTPAGPTALKQLRAAGVDTPVLSGAAMDGSYWIGSVPKLTEFYFATYGSIFGDDPRPEVNEFVAKETKKTGKPPATSFDMTGYALVQALELAIPKAGSLDGPALAKALETFQGQQLITGPTTFTAAEHVNGVRPMAVIQVQDGKHSFVEMYPEK
jgi:branched-chain amino acid transport system substrate-binding protein